MLTSASLKCSFAIWIFVCATIAEGWRNVRTDSDHSNMYASEEDEPGSQQLLILQKRASKSKNLVSGRIIDEKPEEYEYSEEEIPATTRKTIRKPQMSNAILKPSTTPAPLPKPNLKAPKPQKEKQILLPSNSLKENLSPAPPKALLPSVGIPNTRHEIYLPLSCGSYLLIKEISNPPSTTKTEKSEPQIQIHLASTETPNLENEQTAKEEKGDYRQAALDAMNYFRDEHHAPPLKIDRYLNSQAQTYANFLSLKDKFEHSCKTTRCEYGENLSVSSGQPNRPIAARNAVQRWYNEMKDYDWKHPKYSQETGHFTQLIWKGSHRVGIGMAQSAKSGKLYLVVRFSPPGNVDSQFKKNVLPV